MKKILGLLICIFLVVLLVAPVYALSKETYDEMSFWSKLKYNFYTGKILFFTSWGEANCCSTYPNDEDYMDAGDSVRCSDECSPNRCAIDVWYDKYIYLTGCPSGSPDWSRLVWYDEYHGDGASFTAPSTHQCWYYQIYCCLSEEDCFPLSHSTRAYVCEDGNWDYKGSYDIGEYCRWDTSGEDLCWCNDEDEKFYVDESDYVHCRTSPSDSWCTACISHSTYKCYSNNIYYYDSCGNVEDIKQYCSAGCVTGSFVCNTPVCNTEADTNCDGVVDRSELGVYITKWLNNQITRTKLGEVIMAWVG